MISHLPFIGLCLTCIDIAYGIYLRRYNSVYTLTYITGRGVSWTYLFKCTIMPESRLCRVQADDSMCAQLIPGVWLLTWNLKQVST